MDDRPPVTLGNMRSLAKGIAPDRAKRAEVGGHSGRGGIGADCYTLLAIADASDDIADVL